jgi:osmotically-inducible protein OsmY
MKSNLLAAAMMAAGLALSGCASNGDNAAAGESRSAGQFTSDAALTAKVKTALAKDAGLGTAAEVNVQSYRGVVQLNGFVDSQEHAKQAASAARDVEGVRTVQNNLQVKSSAAGR